MSEDQLIADLRARVAGSPATETEIQSAEICLGFSLPPLLRRVYSEVADGGFGPGYGIYRVSPEPVAGLGQESILHAYNVLTRDPHWPAKILPLCDWGCGNWSCLDLRTDQTRVLTCAEERGFYDTGRDLGSWLLAWLSGVNLWEEMFDNGKTVGVINPFTGRPCKTKTRGEPRGPRLPIQGGMGQ